MQANAEENYFFTIYFLIYQTIDHVSAHPQPPTFEEKFDEAGYQSVEAAVKEFEQYYTRSNCQLFYPHFPSRINLADFTKIMKMA